MRHQFRVNRVSFLSQLLQNTGERIDIVENQAVGNEVVVLDDFALFVTVVLGNETMSAESGPLNKPVERLTFVRCRLNQAAQVGIGHKAEQKSGSDGASEFTKSKIESVFATGGAKSAQDGGGGNASGLNGQDNAPHVGEMGLDQLPVDGVGIQGFGMRIVKSFVGLKEREVFPVADAGHELNAQQIGKTENRGALCLGITMNGVGLEVGSVVEEAVENVNRLPDATRNEVAEEGDVGI